MSIVRGKCVPKPNLRAKGITTNSSCFGYFVGNPGGKIAMMLLLLTLLFVAVLSGCLRSSKDGSEDVTRWIASY